MPPSNDSPEPGAWHAEPVDAVLSKLDTGPNGLPDSEVHSRQESHGPNLLTTGEKTGPLKRLLKQFRNVLIYILLIAAALTGFLQEWIDMAVILGVVAINAVVGFIQEGKAENAMEAIRELLTPMATVIRDGNKREIEARELVPGDIVKLESGDKVPADLRVMEARGAQVDEAILTGESEPVEKESDPVDKDEPLGDRTSMAYSGTLVARGRIQGVVVATGMKTEIGHISEMVSGVETLETPLLRRIDTFGRYLALTILVLSGIIFALGYGIMGRPPVKMFLSVVSLAVAAIPEGLPAIMTVTLALGVQRMAKRNAIVRRLPSVETLGSVTVICADKTGTLTRNEMTATEVVLAERSYSVSGSGYEPEGTFESEGEEVSPDDEPGLLELVRAGILATRATLREDDGRWVIDGSPTEGSLIVLARKAGLDREALEKDRPLIDTLPFESERRFSASLYRDAENNRVFVNGAPERILDLCVAANTDSDEAKLDRDYWVEQQKSLAEKGLRVIAVARKTIDTDSLEDSKIEDLTLLGLVGIMDPPRDEAIEAVNKCHRAGITVKMITGDHLLTARSIAEKLGIGDGTHAVAGRDIEDAEGDALADLVEKNDVFARSSPEHKLQIMEALQGRNQVVAMTGDGVNDAPSLKRADVGVAMGVKGSEAAKEASEIVLADDNFATIERAVEEGRTIYDNLIKTILFLLPTNGAQSLVVIGSVLFLFEAMATTPVQILWINMVTAVTLALSLAFEPPETAIMKRPPRPPDAPILSRFLLWRIGIVSILISAAAIGLFLRNLEAVGLETARTIAVNTIVSCQIFYLFSSRFFNRASCTFSGLFGNRKVLMAIGILVLLQGLFTYWPPAQTLFGTRALDAVQWAWILAAGVGFFLVVELEKGISRWHANRNNTP